jgi:hypothetical protein
MKTRVRSKLISALCVAAAAALLTGCMTTKKVDWSSRVGNYTFDQAVQEMGPPDKQATTSDGRTVADWISRSSGGSSFSIGTGFYGGHSGVGVGSTVGSGHQDRVLRLTFGTDGKLTSWSKNY